MPRDDESERLGRRLLEIAEATRTDDLDVVARTLDAPRTQLGSVADVRATLRSAVAIEAWRRLVASIEEELAGDGATLENLAATYRAFARTHPSLYAVASATSVDEDDHAEHVADRKRLLAIFAEVLAAERLGGIEAIDAARSFVSLLHGFVELDRNRQFRLGREPDRSFEWAIRQWKDGLRYSVRQRRRDALRVVRPT